MELTAKDYSEVKNGHFIMVYEQNNISEGNGGVRDIRLDLIGSEVQTEHGIGTIKAVELSPTTFNISERYLIEITNNNGKEILKPLFPDNKMCYQRREFTLIDSKK